MTDNIASGLATFGRFYVAFRTIFAFFIALLLIASGIYLLNKKETHTSHVTATVNLPLQCSLDPQNKEEHCSAEVEYTVNGRKYTNLLAVSDPKEYQNKTTTTVWYNPHNPADAELQKIPYKTLGWILLGIGLLIMVISGVWAWLTYQYSAVATISGIGGGINLLGF